MRHFPSRWKTQNQNYLLNKNKYKCIHIPYTYTHTYTHTQVLEAMRTFRAPLSLAMEDSELEHLARYSRIFTVSPHVPIATLYRQEQCSHIGWGPFGSSAFMLLEGEISVRVAVDDVENSAEKEVMHFTENGDIVGDYTLCTGHSRTHSVYVYGGSTLCLLSKEVWDAGVHRSGEIAVELAAIEDQYKRGGKVAVEVQVMSMKVTHSLKLRRSNLFKMLTDAELEYLASVAQVRENISGQTVVNQGEKVESIFIVVRGTLKVLMAFSRDEDPREVALNIACMCVRIHIYVYVCIYIYIYIYIFYDRC